MGLCCGRVAWLDAGLGVCDWAGVMTKQPEALRLADAIDPRLQETLSFSDFTDASDELRRLHEVNEDLLKTMRQLACLGNGDQYGNSDGNIIAQVALNKATGETE